MKKNPLAMQKTWVQSLGQEDALEKGILPTSVFLPGKPHEHRSLEGYSPRCCRVAHSHACLSWYAQAREVLSCYHSHSLSG